uniref:Helicase ATP-binding domain-containing protein n=1 Tax=viral metagenome TaxID=1070528 RepID=A0A6C0KXH4_9ZZZZ|tara:strand:+ start:524 stop:1975 length:1452 start_codon:yes stop_codon:yes gene_type:complete
MTDNDKSKYYIGRKGYSIHKQTLTQSEMYELRKDLTVKPNSGMPGYSSNVSYPVYRESTNKMYIPRFFGIEKYGHVSKINIAKGEDININFNGSLFDYQTKIIDKYIYHVGLSGGGLLDVEPGKGKTVMALNIISKIKKKTLVIVHKTFLMNQWKERIEQFLPEAKVGFIQGKTVDIDNKDIVIGMLQTLSTKEFSENVINEFGLTVYDECHHLSAEVFSQVMIRINTNYVLGLSGTMTRKDGLTKVFKWFIGPVIHKEKSESQEEVVIKAVYFEDPDNDEYNFVETDFKGNPQYSKMISKICSNDNRTSMILNVIQFELKDNYDQQIMILAHNKSLIEILFHKIRLFEQSVGLYVGGMKELQLKESETKKIIIATYAMASEGLDIKTLTTLCMATPKTDVCQSVGRILRSKHKRPLVIDIVDKHDIFQRQFNKRKTYYNKKKYKIQKYDNLTQYINNDSHIIQIKTIKNKPQCFIDVPDNAF